MAEEQKIEDVDLQAAVEKEGKPKLEVVKQDWTDAQAEEALAMGWHDNRDKLPEGKKFVGPVEYMERNPLYQQLKTLQTNFNQLSDHYQKVAEIEHKKAEKEFNVTLKNLKAEKVKALDDQDHARVVEIDEEIRTTEKPVKAKPDESIMTDWVKENPWYEDNKFLNVEATRVGQILYSPKLYGRPLLDAIKDHLKQAHPEMFSNPNRKKPSAVEAGSNNQQAAGKKASTKDLTADEKTIYNNFKRMGVFKEKGSEEKYLSEVIALRE